MVNNNYFVGWEEEKEGGFFARLSSCYPSLNLPETV